MTFLRSIILGILILTCTMWAPSPALAGDGDVFDWINPAGGEYKDPLNWLGQSTPQFDDDARFDLANTYPVTGEYLAANSFLIGRSNVILDLDCGNDEALLGCGYFDVTDLFIGDGSYEFPRELDNPGSVTLINAGGGYTGTTILGSTKLPLASRLIFQNRSNLRSENFISTPESSVLFKVDAGSGLFADGIITLGSGSHDIDGSLVLQTDPLGAAPVLGQEINLIGSYYSTTPPGLFPFRVLRPRPARSFEIEWDPAQGGERLFARLEVSDTVASVSLSQSDELGDVPTRLLATDLDDDGRDDLVVLIDSGVINVYRSLPNGQFDTPVEYEACDQPVDVTASDFDGDGTTDLAIGCAGDGTLLFYLNPDSDPSQLVEGPSTTVDGEIRSLANTLFVTSLSLVAKKGATVTTRANAGNGRTKGYVMNGANVVQVADVEVGDDPGPSDPIDDENKKDPEPPVGVGATSGALVATPVFQVLRPTTDGFDIEKTISVSGRVIDFDSGDIDGDGTIETLVLTAANRIDLLRPLLTSDVQGSIGFRADAVSIAVANLDGDPRPEVVIGFERDDGTGFFRIYRTEQILVPGSPSGSEVRPYLTRQIQTSLQTFDDPLVSATSLSNGFLSISGIDTAGIPVLRTFDYRRVPVSTCSTFDLNGDGFVDSNDLGRLIAAWGACGGSCPEDFNDDGRVDSADMGLLFSNWGPC